MGCGKRIDWGKVLEYIIAPLVISGMLLYSGYNLGYQHGAEDERAKISLSQPSAQLKEQPTTQPTTQRTNESPLTNMEAD